MKMAYHMLPPPAHTLDAFWPRLAPPLTVSFSFNFLQDNNTLETLDLEDNNIGDKDDEGAVALAKAFEVLYTCFLWQTLPSKFTLGVMAAARSLTYLVTPLSSSL